MKIELVGGPMDGQFLEVEDGRSEWRIAGKPEDFYHNMLAPPNTIPSFVSHLTGTYKRRNARSSLYDWQGWA
jgi:hypothetical protein